MILIANVNKDWGIGKDGDLLCKIPEDMKKFKEISNEILNDENYIQMKKYIYQKKHYIKIF